MQYGMVGTSDGWSLDLSETLVSEVLQDNGYSTYMIGKWHLGHYSPKCLPTARGFDYFLGYLGGEIYYWSKRVGDGTIFHDFIYSNSECYAPYNGSDLHTYSTYLFRNKAIDVIEGHDYSTPLFLYLSFQAVHSPFYEIDLFSSGVPEEYLDSDVLSEIRRTVVGHNRRQYAMHLWLMDQAVERIVNATHTAGQHHNTYFIFA
jgi:arylsulfatase A-like enzyme